MSGYALINKLIDGRIDLLSLGHLRLFLELNALVLCGRDEQKRLDAARHLAATDRYFFDNIDGGIRDAIEWHGLHANESAWIRAAGVYIRILSEPQLFIEGNHRTGALVMSHILAPDSHPRGSKILARPLRVRLGIHDWRASLRMSSMTEAA